jgi:hypothetical protein
MKANKALRRLTEIGVLMSDVVERYPTSAPAVRKALQDAMAAVTVAKEAVDLEASPKNLPVEQHEPTSRTMPGILKAKRKLGAAAVPKEVAAAQARTATKTRAPVRKAVVKAKKAPASVQVAAKPAD